MADMCEGTFEFVFDDKKQAEKMQSDFWRLWRKKGDNPAVRDIIDGGYFSMTYFPTVDHFDCRSEILEIQETEKFGDKYGFKMYTDDAWDAKVGLWTAICKKYYGGEVHYSEYEPECGVCCRWDPDGSINGTGKYRLELNNDNEWEIYANVDSVEDIKSLTDGAFDHLYKDGDSIEDFVDKIHEELGEDADASICEWDECPPEEDDDLEDFDLDSIQKVDIDALLGDDKGGK